MAFVFQPAIFRSSTIFRLPRPIVTVRIQESWNYERFKVPLKDGDRFVGHSREGIDLFVDGQIGSLDGSLKLSEEEMFSALETLRDGLNVSGDSPRFEFFLYLDEIAETYRKFRDCSTVRAEYDLSNPHLFTYSAAIHAEDPAIYDTEPGI